MVTEMMKSEVLIAIAMIMIGHDDNHRDVDDKET
jgi:hypothetical protein